MDYDVRFVAKRWQHHSTHSGYDQLVGWLGSAIEPLNVESLRAKWVPGRVAVALASRSGNALYSYLAFYEEWAATRDMLFNHSPRVYHVLYADDTYCYLGSLGKGRNSRIVATYHLPPSDLRKLLHSVEHLKKLDGLIVVGRNQIPFFEPIVGLERIFFIPHGVDVHTFTPGRAAQLGRSAKGVCLFVGVHKRDLVTLRRVFEIVRAQDRNIKFAVVTSRSNHQLFVGLENVDLMSDLPEPELISLYQDTDLLLQPLEDGTANNAILEGMACGLPTVATDIGAVRDYMDEECGILVPPHCAEAMADAVLSLYKNDSMRGQMAVKARERALQFDWSIIVDKMKQVYSQTLSRG
jgi:glycosyltransferase involved in cell wall biosynthesis